MINPLRQLVEAFSETLLGFRCEVPDDLAKLCDRLAAIVQASAAQPGVQGCARRAMDEIECGDYPLGAETIAALHSISHEMLVLVPEVTAAPAPVVAAPTQVVRDEDTLGIFKMFFEDTEDGLIEADNLLLHSGGGSLSGEAVNALFRIFHTMKGVAGFLDLVELGRLTHTAETLLGSARDGSLVLGPSALESLFESTKLLRTMTASIAEAVEHSTSIPSHASRVDALVAWLERENRGESRAVAQVGAQLAQPVEEALQDSRGQRSTIKVDVERVDSVLETIGELVLLESMLTHASEMDMVKRLLKHLGKISKNLQGLAMRMRMVPVQAQFQRLPRIVRDAAAKAKKDVQIEVEGASAELDRSVVDRLGDPLVHILRNAVDHGIEPPDVRIAAGKPATGTIRVSAFYEGSAAVIEVSDDGRGLDRNAILKKARKQGLVNDDVELTDDEVNHLIFEPGFSTAEKITELSGRGVGLDVVKKTIHGLRGRIVIKSVLGEGTTFRMILPLTLAIIDGTVVRVGAERYVIPSLAIVESLRPQPDMIGSMGGHRELVRFRKMVLPLFRTRKLLDVPEETSVATADEDPGMLVVLDSGSSAIALHVDEILGQQQVVVKNLEGTIAQSEFFVGGAILSDGHVALILNADELGQLAENVSLNGRREAA